MSDAMASFDSMFDWRSQPVAVMGRVMLFGNTASGTLYHGTTAVFASGDVIQPGHGRNFVESAEDRVSLTSDPLRARYWAEQADAAAGGVPRVYEVDPLGFLEPWRVGLENFGQRLVVWEARAPAARVIGEWFPQGPFSVDSDEYELPTDEETIQSLRNHIERGAGLIHLNLEVDHVFGAGLWGRAFRLRDGRAIKITGAQSREVECLQFTQGKDYGPHFPRVYGHGWLNLQEDLLVSGNQLPVGLPLFWYIREELDDNPYDAGYSSDVAEFHRRRNEARVDLHRRGLVPIDDNDENWGVRPGVPDVYVLRDLECIPVIDSTEKRSSDPTTTTGRAVWGGSVGTARKYEEMYEALHRAAPRVFDPTDPRCDPPEDPDWPTPPRLIDAEALLQRLSLDGKRVALLVAVEMALPIWGAWRRAHGEELTRLATPPAVKTMPEWAATMARGDRAFNPAAAGWAWTDLTSNLSRLAQSVRYVSDVDPVETAVAAAIVEATAILANVMRPVEQGEIPAEVFVNGIILALGALGEAAGAGSRVRPSPHLAADSGAVAVFLPRWWQLVRCRLAFADAPTAEVLGWAPHQTRREGVFPNSPDPRPATTGRPVYRSDSVWPTWTIPAGTILYHGTAAPEGWTAMQAGNLTTIEEDAKNYALADWGYRRDVELEHGRPRIHVYRVESPTHVLVIENEGADIRLRSILEGRDGGWPAGDLRQEAICAQQLPDIDGYGYGPAPAFVEIGLCPNAPPLSLIEIRYLSWPRRTTGGRPNFGAPSQAQSPFWRLVKSRPELGPAFFDFVVEKNRDDRDEGELEQVSQAEIDRLIREWDNRQASTGTMALVLIHVDSLAAYAWEAGREPGTALADRLLQAATRHAGPLVVVANGWDAPIARPIVDAGRRWGTVLVHDESRNQPWGPFLGKLRRVLQNQDVTRVLLGGVWFDPTGRSGCVTYVQRYLVQQGFEVEVVPDLVACE